MEILWDVALCVDETCPLLVLVAAAVLVVCAIDCAETAALVVEEQTHCEVEVRESLDGSAQAGDKLIGVQLACSKLCCCIRAVLACGHHPFNIKKSVSYKHGLLTWIHMVMEWLCVRVLMGSLMKFAGRSTQVKILICEIQQTVNLGLGPSLI